MSRSLTGLVTSRDIRRGAVFVAGSQGFQGQFAVRVVLAPSLLDAALEASRNSQFFSLASPRSLSGSG
jgi:hypothetical protein